MSERVERIVIGKAHSHWKACHRLCSWARRLGNCAVYILRQRTFEKLPAPTRKELDTELRETYTVDYRRMPSAASAQRQGQVIAKEFKSFGKAMAAFSKDASKFKARPNLPGYRKRYRTFYVGRNGYQIVDHKLILTGGEEMGFAPLPIRCCENQEFNAEIDKTIVGDVRIVPKGNSFIVELTYKERNPTTQYALDKNHACLIDLGVNNLATLVTTRPGIRPILVKGGVIKSINQHYNKLMANLRSHGKFKHFAVKGFKRERRITDCLHKTSRLIVNYCLTHDLGRIVIGHNKDWKQESNLGKRNNQTFVNIPHSVLIEQIRYKAESLGIEVVVREESYSSKASALDFDEIPTYGDNKTVHFSGKRIHRGLYRCGNGRLINADVQAAMNIGRKELGNEWLKELLEVDGGIIMDMPVTIRKINQKIDSRWLLELGVRSQETTHVSAW